ncbi:hypothetical protein BsWGS_09772 [Bradybaena similaris]
MYVNALVLCFVIFCSSAISKPMDGDGKGEDLVVNMNANGEQVNANRDSNTGSIDNEVPNNPPANQGDNPPANQNGSPLANQEGNPPVNDETNRQNDNQRLDDHTQVADVANENPHEPTQEQKEEVDWGHGETRVLANVDVSNLQRDDKQEQGQQTDQQQQNQQAEQQQQGQQQTGQQQQGQQQTGQQQQGQQQTEQQQQGQHQQAEQQQQQQQQQAGQQQQEPHQQAEQQPDSQQETHIEKTEFVHDTAHPDIGVVEPEHMVHGDEQHGDHHGDPENATRVGEQEAEMQQHGQERIDAENREMEDVQPKVIGGNVHDSTSRRFAEFVKDRQFLPDNAEEALHGGQHVHEEDGEGRPKQAQAGDVEGIVHGEAGVHDDHHQQDNKAPLTADPDEMMHAGEEGDHPHDRHESVPGVDTPNGTLVSGHHKANVQKHTDQDDVGPEVEPLVHGGEHVHGKEADNKTRHKVRYQDIIDLGLSQELLKGIDLSKLLEQEKKEMEAFHHDKNQKEGVKEGDGDNNERDALFWQKQVTDLRKVYLAKLYDKVRHLSNPDLENAVWEKDELNDSPHEGESKVEHEMEMWASTASKGNRKRYKDMVEAWQKKGDGHKERQEENKTVQGEPVHEEKHVENTEAVPVEVADEHLNRDQNEHLQQDQGGDVDKNDGQESNDL